MPKPKNGKPKKPRRKSKSLPDKERPSPISKNAAYQKAASYFKEALDTCVQVMRNSNNDNAKLGAARTIINKVLPDLKASEISGKDGKELILRLIQYGADSTS